MIDEREGSVPNKTIYDTARESLNGEEKAVFDRYNETALRLSREMVPAEMPSSDVIKRAYRQVPGAEDVLRRYDQKVASLREEGELVE